MSTFLQRCPKKDLFFTCRLVTESTCPIQGSLAVVGNLVASNAYFYVGCLGIRLLLFFWCSKIWLTLTFPPHALESRLKIFSLMRLSIQKYYVYYKNIFLVLLVNFEIHNFIKKLMPCGLQKSLSCTAVHCVLTL
jgi:hypothetical protein